MIFVFSDTFYHFINIYVAQKTHLLYNQF